MKAKSDQPKQTAIPLRDRILQADDLPVEAITVKGWNVKVGIKTLTALERSDFFTRCSNGRGGYDPDAMLYQIIVSTAVDPDTNENLFGQDDIEKLKKKSGAALDSLAKAAMKLNRMTEEQAGEIEKN